jgi:hypothetical protein
MSSGRVPRRLRSQSMDESELGSLATKSPQNTPLPPPPLDDDKSDILATVPPLSLSPQPVSSASRPRPLLRQKSRRMSVIQKVDFEDFKDFAEPPKLILDRKLC